MVIPWIYYSIRPNFYSTLENYFSYVCLKFSYHIVAFPDVINAANDSHADVDIIESNSTKGSCLLAKRAFSNTGQRLWSYPDSAIMTHRNSVTGKETLTTQELNVP